MAAGKGRHKQDVYSSYWQTAERVRRREVREVRHRFYNLRHDLKTIAVTMPHRGIDWVRGVVQYRLHADVEDLVVKSC